MKDFYIHMSNGKTYLARGEELIDIKYQIGQSRLINGGFMDVRIPSTYEWAPSTYEQAMINVEQIVSITKEDN